LKTITNQTYFPQLDALRFFAVLGVMVAHNWHPRRLPWLFGDLDWAGLGVRLFFVLSGFLITGILLDCRKMAETGSQSPLFFVRQFYARRFLRIFPIYYLVILIAFLVNLPPTREILVWLVTYTSNIYITMFNTWIGRLGHFWTLAVEEQFYLIWPWLVLFAPKKSLVPAMLIAVLIAPVYRYFAYFAYPFDIGAMDFKASTLTPGSLDSLGIGSMLALLWHSNLRKETLQKYLTILILPTGIVFYVFTLVLYHYRIKPVVFFTFGDLAAALIFAWLVSAASLGFKGLTGKFLEFRPLIYLGKITYGIYVYHYLVPLILIPIFNGLGVSYRVPSLTNFILSGFLSIIIASVSWHFFELPINNLKRHFQYAPKRIVSSPIPELLEGES
jgi:peptidoglycan/LPS O-acetylase OafA/YrhL